MSPHLLNPPTGLQYKAITDTDANMLHCRIIPTQTQHPISSIPIELRIMKRNDKPRGKDAKPAPGFSSEGVNIFVKFYFSQSFRVGAIERKRAKDPGLYWRQMMLFTML